jgi:hypothetical protein
MSSPGLQKWPRRSLPLQHLRWPRWRRCNSRNAHPLWPPAQPSFQHVSRHPCRDGTASILLDLGQKTTLPPARLTLELANGTSLPVSFRPVNFRQLCSYCRATDHRRNRCKSAPACRSCGSHAHPAVRCNQLLAPRPPGPPIPRLYLPSFLDLVVLRPQLSPTH